MTRLVSASDGGAPRLRLDLNLMTLLELPSSSQAPRGTSSEVAVRLRAAGYDGVQTTDLEEWRSTGLGVSSWAVIREPSEAEPLIGARHHGGAEATTIHLGTGMESDAQALRLVEAVLKSSVRNDHPVFVETHRGTLTQDIRRTLNLIQWFPELRINADLSHWYTGLSMTYGDFADKLERMRPLFERVGFIQGRIGNQCCVQVPIGIGDRDEPHLSDFRRMWTLCCSGFLRVALPGEVLIFAPELLANVFRAPEGAIYMDYAQLVPGPDGRFVERSDRWDQALSLCAVIKECFADAVAATARPSVAVSTETTIA